MVLDTFPKYLLFNAERFASRPAMRPKDYGIWQSWTWSEQLLDVRRLALAPQLLGLRRGERIAIAGANRLLLYWSFAAAQSLGAIPVYTDAVAEKMAYVLDQAEVRFAIVAGAGRTSSTSWTFPTLSSFWTMAGRSPTARPTRSRPTAKSSTPFSASPIERKAA